MRTIEHRPEALLKIFIRYAGDPPPENDVVVTPDQREWTQADKNLCKKVAASKSGEKFVKLFKGDIEGYNSHSEAELAFYNILAFWCAKDSEQMDRIGRKSGLYRPKWDARRGELTYGELTLQKAIAGTKNVYQGELPTSTTGIKPNSFKLLTNDELVALPPMQWRIKGVLPDIGIGVLFGPSGSGKSFVGLDMVQAVASGSDWFGFRTTGTGSV